MDQLDVCNNLFKLAHICKVQNLWDMFEEHWWQHVQTGENKYKYINHIYIYNMYTKNVLWFLLYKEHVKTFAYDVVECFRKHSAHKYMQFEVGDIELPKPSQLFDQNLQDKTFLLPNWACRI